MFSQTTLSPQLVLSIQPTDESDFSHFCWGENAVLREQLFQLFESPPLQPKESFFYIWGAEGVGKSHLLQACCLQWNHQQPAVYLPLKTLSQWSHYILEGLEHQSFIVIDDIETIAGNAHWEEALFCLFQQVKDDPQKTILVSSREAPTQSSLLLPDLRSRLHWGIASQLLALTDAQKTQTLQYYATRRGFDLPTQIAEFLIQRFDRNMANLLALLNTIDRASLVEQRKITLPFVKRILGGK